MKRIAPVILISFFMIFASLPIKAHNNEDYEYEQALASVTEQLESQDGLRFLPVFEEILKQELKQARTSPLNYSAKRSSSSKVTLRNGGHIYYPNYLGYNVSVSEVYLAKNDATRFMAKQMTPSAMGALVGKIPIVGDVYDLLDFVSSWSLSRTFKQATDGKGTLKIFRSSDADGSAKVISYWSTYPYATLYSGGRLNRK